MRADKLAGAIDKIDDSFILEADEFSISNAETVHKKNENKSPLIYLIPAAAAAIAIIVAAETFRKPLDNGFETVNNETEVSYSKTDPVTEQNALVSTGSESRVYITSGSDVSTVPATEKPIVLSTASDTAIPTVISKATKPAVSEAAAGTEKTSDAAITTVSQEATKPVPTSVVSSSEVPEEITCISTEKITSSVSKTDDPTCTDGIEYTPPGDNPSEGDPYFDPKRDYMDILTDEYSNRYYIIRQMGGSELENIDESCGIIKLENPYGYPVEGELFSIKGISNSYAVILKTKNTYTAYLTDRAGEVKTAGELFYDTDLRSSEAEIFEFSDSYRIIGKYDIERLTDMIFNGNEESEIMDSIDTSRSMYKATLIYVPVKSEVQVEIFENGYIYIKLLGREYYYKNSNIDKMKKIYDWYNNDITE